MGSRIAADIARHWESQILTVKNKTFTTKDTKEHKDDR
jgi:hypothetical protein